MTRAIVSYLSSLLTFVACDMVWLGLMAPRFYRPILGDSALAGVNLPLLIKALGNRRGPVDELVAMLIDSGQRAIRLVDVTDLEGGAATREAGDGAR